MDTIISIFTNPVKAFGSLKDREKFPYSVFFILLALMLINLILLIPVTEKVTELAMAKTPLTDEQLDMALQMTHRLRYLQTAGALVMTAVMYFVYAFVLYIVQYIAKAGVNYAKILYLTIYSSLVVAVGSLVNTALIYGQGIDGIESPFDIARTGLNVFTTVDSAGLVLYALLSAVTPFEILFLAALAAGLKAISGSGWLRSAAISIAYWAVLTGFSLCSAYLSETLMKKSGIF
ncbi:MAG: YIP1 family protein [Tannerella sp.]|jgi:hypothetical protein|nr:YIP1 family protein [Tannerella sp.]